MTLTISQRPPSSFFLTDASTPSPFSRIGSVIGSSSLSTKVAGRRWRSGRASYTRCPPARQAQTRCAGRRAEVDPRPVSSKKKRRPEGRLLNNLSRSATNPSLRNFVVDPLNIPIHAQNLSVLKRLRAGLALILAGLV